MWDIIFCSGDIYLAYEPENSFRPVVETNVLDECYYSYQNSDNLQYNSNSAKKTKQKQIEYSF